MNGYENRACAAHGCPLPGGLIENGQRLCRHHYGQGFQRWPAITAALREHEKLLQLVQKILGDGIDPRGPDGKMLAEAEQLEKIAIWAAKHYPELANTNSRTVKTWAYVADSWLASTAAQKSKRIANPQK